MIYFLTTRRNSFPIRNFLRSRGKNFVDRMEIIYFDNLGVLRNLKVGTFIFSDFDLLLPSQRKLVKNIYAQLNQCYPQLKLFNDPGKVLLRHDLLKILHDLGINQFNVARASDRVDHLRFPVFIREADRHVGPLTKLLNNAAEVKKNIDVLKMLGYSPNDLLVIEYVNVSDVDGVYNKYAAFILGDRIMPRYLNYSRHWMVKSMVDRNSPLMVSKQPDIERYMKDNPHKEWLQKIFQISGITYGRADYAFVNNKPQLWEINLNPAFVRPPRKRSDDNNQQRLMRDLFYEQFYEELEKIDYKSDEMIKLDISDEDLNKMKLRFRQRLREGFHSRLQKKKPRYRFMRSICFAWARMLVSIQYFMGSSNNPR